MKLVTPPSFYYIRREDATAILLLQLSEKIAAQPVQKQEDCANLLVPTALSTTLEDL